MTTLILHVQWLRFTSVFVGVDCDASCTGNFSVFGWQSGLFFMCAAVSLLGAFEPANNQRTTIRDPAATRQVHQWTLGVRLPYLARHRQILANPFVKFATAEQFSILQGCASVDRAPSRHDHTNPQPTTHSHFHHHTPSFSFSVSLVCSAGVIRLLVNSGYPT